MKNKYRMLLIINTVLSFLFIYPAAGLAVMFVMGGASIGQVDDPPKALFNLAMFVFFVGIFLPLSIIPSIIFSWVFYYFNKRRLTIFFALFHWIVLSSLIVASLAIFNLF